MDEDVATNELVIINEKNIKDMIHEIRGQKVMLDFDLARIYGYETKAFNQQIKRNIDKFPEDFMFQLTWEEAAHISRSQIVTMKSRGTNIKYLPYAFTEQGIYMLMTVLRGELAIKQSLALIRLFKAMKDHIIESNGLLTNTNQYIESRFEEQNQRLEIVESKLDVVMENFVDPSTYKQFIILDGQRIEADLVYKQIYSLAKQSIILVDDYINTRTLSHFKICPKDIEIIFISNNISKEKITNGDINDFISDTGIIDIIIKSNNRPVHDRYIVIDYNTDNEIIYLCGPSSKDAGHKIGTIIRIEDTTGHHHIIDELLS